MLSSCELIIETNCPVVMLRTGALSIEDLRGKNEFGGVAFTNELLIGVAHYDDMMVKLPRDEIERIAEFVRTCIADALPGRSIKAEITGSYR